MPDALLNLMVIVGGLAAAFGALGLAGELIEGTRLDPWRERSAARRRSQEPIFWRLR